MTEDEISEYVERMRGMMAAAEAYAAENPSEEVERAKRFNDACRDNPEPSEPVAFLEWTYSLLWSHAYYRETLLEHYDRRPH